MCRDHGKAIDSTDSEFTVERLRERKKQAENESMNGRMDLNNASASTGSTSIPSRTPKLSASFYRETIARNAVA
jgi:hypothetical protein